jgi:hypothetical protein
MLKPIKEVVSHRSCACGDYFTSRQCSCCPYFYNTGEANYCVINGWIDELDEFVPLRE